MKRQTTFVAGLAFLALVAAFLWGFLAHRYRAFPYSWLKEAATVCGLAQREEAPEIYGVAARSPDLESLRALAYVDATFDPEHDRAGVLLHDPEHAFAGLSLFHSQSQSKAYLIDMEGRVAHRWSSPEDKGWQHTHLLPEGELLVLVDDERLFKLDRESRPLWSLEAPVHHDFDVDNQGRIHALYRRPEKWPEIHLTQAILGEGVLVYSPDGQLTGELSILDALLHSPHAALIPRVSHLDFKDPATPVEVLHTNHVEVVGAQAAARSPLFAEGQLLISVMYLNAVVLLDPETGRVPWLWGPNNIVGIHHPTLLENGHVLLFSNGTDHSRVLEVDPSSQGIVWEYEAAGFYSRTRGSAQRLPNGNTLVTESDAGYVFELTPEGKTVWLFANPEMTDEGERFAIWRMARFAPGELVFVAQGF